MKETKKNVIHIKDIDSKTMEALVEYLYTESPGNFGEFATELFKAADKYNIVGLRVSI